MLDPQARRVLDDIAALGLPPVAQSTPASARERMRRLSALLGPPAPVASVEDRVIAGPGGPLPLRIYRPEGATARPFVFLHGGAWIVGDLATHDNVVRDLANAFRCVMFAVDYRLAPEHKFPAAVEDAHAAARWVAEHAAELGVDATQLVVGGDSAGGNLAAAVALKSRDEGGPPLAGQVLLYPITDHDFETHSYRNFAEGYLLTRAAMMWSFNHYIREPADAGHPYISMLRAPDLAGLPPAIVVTAGFDVLCDEGDAYARRLQQAGVPVTHLRYPGMIHDFLRRTHAIDAARTALADIALAIDSYPWAERV